MKLPTIRDRRFANQTIAAVVLFHFISLMAATRFDQLWVTQFAVRGTLVLYLLLLPILWLWHRATRLERAHDALSDIRKSFSESERPPYNPRRYFALDKGIFVGLDDRRKPVYIPWDDYNTTHMQLIGTTGAGKGVMSSIMLIQCALHGQRVIIFDPKQDKHAPQVFALAAKQAGLPFHLIDLRPEAPPQINPFRLATYPEMKELLITTFDLTETGNIADFYRVLDRRAARDVIRRAGSNPTIKRMLEAAEESPFITDKEAVIFQEKLTELRELDVLDTDDGPNLSDLISTPGFLYIVGNKRSVESLQCQKLLLLRILQIIEKRPEALADRLPIALMLDEFKYILSPPALEALGTVRDKNCHLTLAHQSVGDIAACKGLDPAAVRGAVFENTGIKFIYRAETFETADWASKLSGTIIARTRHTDIQQSAFDAPTAQYHEVERALLTVNDMYAMPKLVGMLFGVGLAKRCQAARMPKGEPPQLTPAPRAPQLRRRKSADRQASVSEPDTAETPRLISQTAEDPPDERLP
jgi:TraM recognition site of TraD and TraG/AAA-like domain